MRVLCVDTSAGEAACGIFDGQRALAIQYRAGEKQYNKIILAMVEECLEKAELQLADIDVFAAALGPGSFTGIRVGMAVMKAFAHSLGKSFYGVSTLDILAASADKKSGNTAAALDARRNEVYWARYGNAKSGVKRTGPYRLDTLQRFNESIKKSETVAVLENEKTLAAAILAGKIHSAGHVDMEAFNTLVQKAGKKALSKKNTASIAPVYIRASEAEVKRKQCAK